MKSAYIKEVISMVPRLLTQIDRDPYSETYGSCTREYWHIRFNETPNSQHQSMVLSLALIHNHKFKNNIYYNNKDIRKWAIAVMDFWTKIQNKNGSFNEVYINQDSYAATAFTTYTISESFKELRKYISKQLQERIIIALKKSANWLIKTKEEIAINQVFGAVAGLYNVYMISNDKRYLKGCKEKIKWLKKIQTKEGWFNEYGGADIGYTSISIDYLAKYWKESKDEDAFKIGKKMIEFIKYFLHEDGTVGGEYGSRNTEYLIPDGFEIFGNKIKDARHISNYLLDNLASGNYSFISKSVDDRYFSYLNWAYLQAYLNFKERKNFKFSLPLNTIHKKHFSISGLYSFKNNQYHFISNFKKGGVFRLYSKKINYCDGGVFGVNKKGITYVSQYLSNPRIVTGEKISINGKMHKISFFKTSFFKIILIKMFNLVFPGPLRKLFLDILRKIVVKSKVTDMRYVREFKLNESNVIITDIIKGDKKLEKLKIEEGPMKSMHFASSLFFYNQELDFYKIGLPNLANNFLKKGKVVLNRNINIKKGEITLE